MPGILPPTSNNSLVMLMRINAPDAACVKINALSWFPANSSRACPNAGRSIPCYLRPYPIRASLIRRIASICSVTGAARVKNFAQPAPLIIMIRKKYLNSTWVPLSFVPVWRAMIPANARNSVSSAGAAWSLRSSLKEFCRLPALIRRKSNVLGMKNIRVKSPGSSAWVHAILTTPILGVHRFAACMPPNRR